MSVSCGIILYRKLDTQIEYFLVRPGGPFYKKKENGIWSIPKGMIKDGETEKEAAIREFKEETGHLVENNLTHLGKFKLRKSKRLSVFACEKNLDENKIKSNLFMMEYPKNSGNFERFPEIDKAAWYNLINARIMINLKLISILELLESKLTDRPLSKVAKTNSSILK